jgi:hypothetical protein
VWLRASRADLNIVGEACLGMIRMDRDVSEDFCNLPSWLREELSQSHYLVPNADCSPGSLATKTGQLPLSYAQSFPALVQEPSPIETAPGQHHTPCMHA